jgi:prepilin-type N-terminal cleavage/methylation domain-containing protein/prepilin-type processing-associated H-X9-DG protein
MNQLFRYSRIGRRASAFTLIELLTVIAIIGILAAIIIPTVGAVRETARNATCKTRLRQWAVAFTLYANDNRGTYTVLNGQGPWCQVGGSATQSPPYTRYLNAGVTTGTSQDFGDFAYCPAQDGAKEYGSTVNSPLRTLYVAIVPTSGGVTVDAARISLNRAASPGKTIMLIERQWNDATGTPAPVSGVNANDLSFRKENASSMSGHYVSFNRHKKRPNVAFMDAHVASMSWDDGNPGTSLATGGARGSMNLDWFALDR